MATKQDTLFRTFAMLRTIPKEPRYKATSTIHAALNDTPHNQYASDLHLKMIKYAHEFKNITDKEFCEGVGLLSSFGTKFIKICNLT
ncbi:hypothetical protein MACH16_15790 [Marinomonas pontica]|uniref:HTH-like domain-containing protein n=1 Tax=Marinomonas pontica TaxID=264739 RepID=A0ABM8FFJ7_9GAMM|nr:hypothetical protein MACH16_15790 [Marinomonas pontica]